MSTQGLMLDRMFSFELEGAGSLAVATFRGREALSEPYRFDVEVIAPHALDPSSCLGHAAVLSMLRAGEARHVSGIVERVTRGKTLRDGEGALVLRLVPRLGKLALRSTSRVFQDKTTKSIVSTICAEHGVVVRAELDSETPSREICIQHEETDLAFVTRLLAEEGIAYRFEQPEAPPEKLASETLVLFDAAARYPDLGGANATGRAELVYRAQVEGDATLQVEENAVWSFTRKERRAPTSVRLRSFDFRHPERLPEDVAPAKASSPLEQIVLHHGPYGEMQVDPEPASRVLDQTRRRARVAEGRSATVRLSPGAGFSLDGHPDASLNGAHAVVAVRHRGQEVTSGLRYESAFEAVDRSFLLRPARPARRVRQSLETATVTGPEGEEIHVDAHGRVQVRFHWDLEAPSGGPTSCWIRVAQGLAGDGWGAQLIPRVGMEVLVAFLGGDPDRPVIVACLPNATHPPPFPLPGDKTRTGWRTRSTPAADPQGYNEISMDDEAGQEQVRVVAQRDLDIEVKGAMHTSVLGEQTLAVGADRTVSIAGRSTTRVEGASAQEFLGGGRIAIKGRLDESIEGARAVQVGEELEETVGGSVTRRAGASEEQTVVGPWTCRAESIHTLIVGTHESVGHAEVQVRGSSVHMVDGAAIMEAGESLTLVCGESRIELLPDRIRLTSPTVELLGKELFAKGDGPSLRLTDRAELVADSLKLYGKESSLELEKDARLLGKKVFLNCGPPPPPPEGESGEPQTKPFSVRLQDERFEPYAQKSYELRTQGFKAEGSTGADGAIAHDIPKEARIVNIDIWTKDYPTGPRKTFTFDVADVAPIATLPGLRTRLRNLGYFKGRIEGEEMDAATRGAIHDFQVDHELPTSGEPDAATIAAITERFEG